MIIAAVLIGYLLFAIAIGKLLAYAALQDEVWSDIRENVIRPVPAPGAERGGDPRPKRRPEPVDAPPATNPSQDRPIPESITH